MDNDVTLESREKLINFVKGTVSDLMTKLLEIITMYISNLDNIFPHLINIFRKNSLFKSNRLNEIVSEKMGKIMLRFALNKLGIQLVESPTINKPVIINYSTNETEEEEQQAVNNNTMLNATIEKPVKLKNNFGLNKTQVIVKPMTVTFRFWNLII